LNQTHKDVDGTSPIFQSWWLHLRLAIVTVAMLNALALLPTLGSFRWHMPTPEARAAAWKAKEALADERAVALAPVFIEIRANGMTGLTAIANELIRRGIRTPHGHRYWQASQVAGVLKRLERL
jgi:hypothetical protein